MVDREGYDPAPLYRRIVAGLARGERLALATIVIREGSGPREAGAALLLTSGGETLGTVGGGALEMGTIALTREVLKTGRPRLRRFAMTGASVTSVDMICGGEAEILVERLDPADAVLRRIFAALLGEMEAGRPSWLVRSFGMGAGKGEAREATVGRGLITEESFDAGSLDLTGVDAETLMAAVRRAEGQLVAGEGIRFFFQSAGPVETVYLFGAGHVARALAPIATALGFRVVVIDDRPDFVTADRFPTVDLRLAVPAYAGCFAELPIDRTAYLVIITHGHAHDREVLVEALATSARYIGMIASRRKRELLFHALREEGVSPEALARVHSPIGLAIGAQTPAEIAVSIAAELVAVRRVSKRTGVQGALDTRRPHPL